MRKKVLSFTAVMILTLSVCMTAFAEGEAIVPPIQQHGGTAAELKSYGRIVYQKGTESMKIDSDDLYMLADQIDQVKLDVTDQLEALNTYFSTGEGIGLKTSEDFNVVHATPTEENAVDPLDVNFDTLLEGIAVSQSVSPDVTAYGYPAGTELYKTKDGLLTTNGSANGAQKISVTAATADNLSAGTAAWVDGNLVLGKGGDNKISYESGSNQAKALQTASGSFTVYGHGSTSTVNLGKKPRVVVLYSCHTGHGGWSLAQFQIYDSTRNLKYRYMMMSLHSPQYDHGSDIEITDNGFKYTQRLGEAEDTILSAAEFNYYVIF